MKTTIFNTPAVGILANPESGRDIRRLVAKASVFHTAEKCNMIQRILLALASVGVFNVVMMPDKGGIAGRVLHSNKLHRAVSHHPLPEMHFIDMPIECSPVDTIRAIERMVEMGVAVIIVLGGDGTHRLVAKACGSTPLVALSTGTNNAFPEFREATIAGISAGLVATEAVPLDEVIAPNKVLRIERNGSVGDLALVDLCVTSEHWIGTKALWRPHSFSELFVTFAEADAIGLSSIAGLLHPVGRRSPYGLRLVLTPPSDTVTVISVPIAPGLITDVGVAEVTEIRPKEVCHVHARRGVVALDGEREIEFSPADDLKIWLETDGPKTINISEVMAKAAKCHYFVRFAAPVLHDIKERGGKRGASC